MTGPLTIQPFDFSAITAFYNARAGIGVGAGAVGGGAGGSAQASGPAPPWRSDPDAQALSAMVRERLAGRPVLPDSVRREALRSNDDVTKIFAAYEALEKLRALADAAANQTLKPFELDRAGRILNDQIGGFLGFVDEMDLEKVLLIKGEDLTRSRMETGVRRPSYDYVGTQVVDGSVFDPMPGFDGTERFTINVSKSGGVIPVEIDLADIGPGAPSLDALVTHVNDRLAAAGVVSRLERVKLGEPNEFGIVQGSSFGLKLRGVITERVSFSAPDQTAAVFTAGATGADGRTLGQIVRWDGLGGAPTAVSGVFGEDAAEIETAFDAVTSAPDGSVYAIARTTGEVNGLDPRGEADYALVKYDASGRLAWSRLLGAQGELSNASLTVGADGRVAVAGATDASGDRDSFVTVFAGNGEALWTREADARSDDEALSVAFATDGSVLIAGRTASSLDGQTAAGGHDAYVQKLDATGAILWTRQWGGTDNDRATAVTLADDGGVLVAARTGEAASIVRLDPATGGEDWSVDLGDASVSGLTFADGALYAAGATNASDFAGDVFGGAAQDDTDAFALKIDLGPPAPSVDWMQRFGGAGAQSASGVAVSNGTVYLSGSGAGTFGATAGKGTEDAFLSALDAGSGAVQWTDSVSGRARVSSANGLAVAATGASETLSKLGLPSGAVPTGLSEKLSDQIPVRAGDHFYVRVDDGRARKIEIAEGETVRSLSFKVNAALLLSGRADVVRGSAGQRLSIEAARDARIEVAPGAAGADALSALGLQAGLVRNKPIGAQSAVRDGPDVVDLNLQKGFSLATPEDAGKTRDALDSALRQLRMAYRYAVDDPTLRQAEAGDGAPRQGQSSGPTAYQLSQLRNLQAGLARLTSGGGGGIAGLFA